MYYEAATDEVAARKRERQIKAWRREKKVALIERFNPQWRDLSWKIVRAAVDVQS